MGRKEDGSNSSLADKVASVGWSLFQPFRRKPLNLGDYELPPKIPDWVGNESGGRFEVEVPVPRESNLVEKT